MVDMRVFDPRDGQWKESNNPALMMAQFMVPPGEPPMASAINWDAVAEAANYFDEPIEAGKRC